jgi:ABC-type proline/glycine betaine transport system substrate-binding protein
MAHTLETLAPGTPVYVGEVRVGDVRAIYTSGASRQAELIVVHWDSRAEDVAVPAAEVGTVDESGVRLMAPEVSTYATLSAFDPARFPTVHPLP